MSCIKMVYRHSIGTSEVHIATFEAPEYSWKKLETLEAKMVEQPMLEMAEA